MSEISTNFPDWNEEKHVGVFVMSEVPPSTPSLREVTKHKTWQQVPVPMPSYVTYVISEVEHLTSGMFLYLGLYRNIFWC